ncbi:hypothetical protein [Natronolimnohabitans innermongolicus]|uniref:PRC-barrel domain-containing protein n=1 Tax=Natronolimnohabitans innermongolicus JCM 12255 TaxID=1227499 RepID=L9XIP1_9EURY|nr:hypothetical protein [Natronolimnohabitans innermongolicus]ELY61609.1 hypothetical protein C493_02056 [Natronolimnohabitans innermongolicus JCM 12255]
MCARFTDDDEGKQVVNANGERIGIVESVDAGTPYVNPNPDVTDSIKTALGWGDADEETYVLDTDDVEAVTDREIRVRRR